MNNSSTIKNKPTFTTLDQQAAQRKNNTKKEYGKIEDEVNKALASTGTKKIKPRSWDMEDLLGTLTKEYGISNWVARGAEQVKDTAIEYADDSDNLPKIPPISWDTAVSSVTDTITALLNPANAASFVLDYAISKSTKPSAGQKFIRTTSSHSLAICFTLLTTGLVPLGQCIGPVFALLVYLDEKEKEDEEKRIVALAGALDEKFNKIRSKAEAKLKNIQANKLTRAYLLNVAESVDDNLIIGFYTYQAPETQKRKNVAVRRGDIAQLRTRMDETDLGRYTRNKDEKDIFMLFADAQIEPFYEDNTGELKLSKHNLANLRSVIDNEGNAEEDEIEETAQRGTQININPAMHPAMNPIKTLTNNPTKDSTNTSIKKATKNPTKK